MLLKCTGTLTEQCNALWFGVPVHIMRDSGFWIVMRVLRKCAYFARGQVVCIDSCNVVKRTPVPDREPVVCSCARASLV